MLVVRNFLVSKETRKYSVFRGVDAWEEEESVVETLQSIVLFIIRYFVAKGGNFLAECTAF
jgi:hypothetical protein